MSKLPPAAIALRGYLSEHNVSQGRFAVLTLDVTDTALQSWLSGRGRPSLGNALKIEKVTGIPVADWFAEPEKAARHG